MRLWRLTRQEFQALDGEGARLAGGRWNSEGVAVVYTASTLSLAALEYLVHVTLDQAPSDLVAIGIEVPSEASVEVIDVGALPSAWRDIIDHPACVAAGDEWVREERSLLLRVPSAVIPEESNYLLNPAHPQAGDVRVQSVREFALDGRLL